MAFTLWSLEFRLPFQFNCLYNTGLSISNLIPLGTLRESNRLFDNKFVCLVTIFGALITAA